MKAIVVAGAEIDDLDFYSDLLRGYDKIIAADRGADTLRRLGLTPHLLVGDLDSITADTLTWIKAKKVPVRKFPAEKDKTDTHLAIDEALALGATTMTLCGVWGGRIDQTLANVFLLRAALKKSIPCRIIEAAGEAFVVDRHAVVHGAPGSVVSLLALDDCRGLKLSGFKYQLDKADLMVGDTLGVSNVLLGRRGEIELQSGLVLVICLR